MIKPTIGRVVWFTPSKNDAALSGSGQPLAALVTYVHSDRYVNLAVFDANGGHHGRNSAALLQDDDVGNEGGYFAQWMPYQVGQAAKHERTASRSDRELALEVLKPHYSTIGAEQFLVEVEKLAKYVEHGAEAAKA
jgi:hypothetical protein